MTDSPRKRRVHIPPLMGPAEAMSTLRVDNRYLKRLVDSGVLTPVQTLACGTIFTADDVHTAAEVVRGRRKARNHGKKDSKGEIT